MFVFFSFASAYLILLLAALYFRFVCVCVRALLARASASINVWHLYRICYFFRGLVTSITIISKFAQFSSISVVRANCWLSLCAMPMERSRDGELFWAAIALSVRPEGRRKKPVIAATAESRMHNKVKKNYLRACQHVIKDIYIFGFPLWFDFFFPSLFMSLVIHRVNHLTAKFCIRSKRRRSTRDDENKWWKILKIKSPIEKKCQTNENAIWRRVNRAIDLKI